MIIIDQSINIGVATAGVNFQATEKEKQNEFIVLENVPVNIERQKNTRMNYLKKDLLNLI